MRRELTAVSAAPDQTIVRLKVTLSDIRPPIWRRIEVQPDTWLLAFHRIMQDAMGWTNSHLHGDSREHDVVGCYI